MAAPFPEAQFEAVILVFLGILTVAVTGMMVYTWKLHRKLDQDSKEEEEELRVDNIGLSKRSQDVMDAILEEPKMQSELPDELKVSKATVSNAVSELKERKLIKRKKRANSYLIEPDREEMEDQQR